ncbi:MKRN2 opposite strand protein [Alligator mississippiensis]|uniref:MKRN2 opposite strand protein n=1 Tax=Alligator mississippiensis TaxID=8496 RepID=A0A151PJT5_ALLMI|nr:MKRN2 opposite strand protein [Alligator mississippiensis]KYO49025.1 MKRN2 opposite strand protein [Alligator mississippiensis]
MQPWEPAGGVVRFRHCGKFIFGPRVPARCPACGRRLLYRGLEQAPVSVPSPFVNGHARLCAFLLRPTAGAFLGEYDGKSDLHVGITSTNGLVYNYNETGIHRVEFGWEQCISIPLVQPGMYGLLQQWDKYLEEFSAGEAWLPHRYDEHHHNCYTYALAFINCLLAAQGKQQMDKNEFTERFVIPQTRKASKYITLYQAIAENCFYTVDISDQEKNAWEEDKLLN